MNFDLVFETVGRVVKQMAKSKCKTPVSSIYPFPNDSVIKWGNLLERVNVLRTRLLGQGWGGLPFDGVSPTFISNLSWGFPTYATNGSVYV